MIDIIRKPTSYLLQMKNNTISEPCDIEFRDKKQMQWGQSWNQLSVPRLVLLNRWHFNFELLHWCKKKLGESGCFSHITDRSCASDEGDVWNSVPRHLCLHAQDTNTQTETVRRLDHAALSDVKWKKSIKGRKIKTNFPRMLLPFHCHCTVEGKCCYIQNVLDFVRLYVIM